ncbi:MAG: hypothetical protein HY684_03945 [Chloroflexi bacterium]|nr:hypothetical protein [Chloroflexota bacterium]
MAKYLFESTDPLVRLRTGQPPLVAQLKAATDMEQANWSVFHSSIRLKLQAASHFLELAEETLSVHLKITEPSGELAARQKLRWYLEAYLFECMGAYDCLLQELNVVYKCGLKIEKVKWDKLSKCWHGAGHSKGKEHANNECVSVTESVLDELRRTRDTLWFKRSKGLRNYVSHRSFLPLETSPVGWGDKLKINAVSIPLPVSLSVSVDERLITPTQESGIWSKLKASKWDWDKMPQEYTKYRWQIEDLQKDCCEMSRLVNNIWNHIISQFDGLPQ